MSATPEIVILLHGWSFEPTTEFPELNRLENTLKAEFKVVKTFKYNAKNSMREIAGQLFQFLKDLEKEGDFNFQTLLPNGITLVGYSLGGLICRYFVNNYDYGKNVRKVITLGTPHKGVFRSYDMLLSALRWVLGTVPAFGDFKALREVTYTDEPGAQGHKFLDELNAEQALELGSQTLEPNPPGDIGYLCIWGEDSTRRPIEQRISLNIGPGIQRSLAVDLFSNLLERDSGDKHDGLVGYHSSDIQRAGGREFYSKNCSLFQYPKYPHITGTDHWNILENESVCKLVVDFIKLRQIVCGRSPVAKRLVQD